MRSLGAVSRIEIVLLGSVLVFLTAASAWIVVLKFSVNWPLNAVLAAAIIGLVGVRAFQMDGAPQRTSSASCLLSLAVIAVAVAWMIWTRWAGVVLPGHDPITVTTIADRMAGGVLPTVTYRPGDNAYTYPPGYSVALIPIVSMLDKVTALTAFKSISLLSAALIPTSWAWLLIRLFPISQPVWLSLLLSYAVFFGLERTLMFGAAGKNAAYFMLLLAPPTILIMLRKSQRWRDVPIGAVALFGLILMHYSALHLVVCIFAGCAMVDVVRREFDIRRAAALAIMGAAATVSLLLLYGEALADRRSEGFGSFDIPTALGKIVQALTAESDLWLVIFHGDDVLRLRSPYRGPVLLVFAAITVVAWRRLRTREAANIAAGAGAFLAATVLALAMAAQLVPARIQPDFVRWFLWPVQGVVMLSGGLAIATLITAARARRVLAGAALVALAAIGFIAHNDGTLVRQANALLAVQRAELDELRISLLHATDPHRPCFLIGQSVVESAQVAFIHQSFVLGYAEYLTPCTFANGGWLRGPVPNGRALEGYPTVAVLNDLLREGTVLFVGNVDDQNAYASRLGSDFHWSSVGKFSGRHLYFSGHHLSRIERGGK